MEAYKNYLKAQYQPETIRTYILHQENFIHFFPNYENVSYKDFVGYITTLKNRGYQENYLFPIVCAIKKFYDYLFYSDMIKVHPIRNFKLKYEKKYFQIQELFTKEELETLLERNNRYSDQLYRDKIIISLLIYQGLKGSEITQIRIKDINFDQHKLFVGGSINTNSRTLQLNTTQMEWIDCYISNSREKILQKNLLQKSEYLVLSSFANPLTVDSIHHIISTMKGYFPNRKLNLQTIRQSVISHLLNDVQYELEDVQYFIGHKWPSATSMYQSQLKKDGIININLIHPLR